MVQDCGCPAGGLVISGVSRAPYQSPGAPSLFFSNASFSVVYKQGRPTHAPGPLHLLFLAWNASFLEYLRGSLSCLRPPMAPHRISHPLSLLHSYSSMFWSGRHMFAYLLSEPLPPTTQSESLIMAGTGSVHCCIPRTWHIAVLKIIFLNLSTD